MALHELYHSNTHDKYIINKRVYENIKLNFKDDSCLLERCCDICDPKFIIINKPSDDFKLDLLK